MQIAIGLVLICYIGVCFKTYTKTIHISKYLRRINWGCSSIVERSLAFERGSRGVRLPHLHFCKENILAKSFIHYINIILIQKKMRNLCECFSNNSF